MEHIQETSARVGLYRAVQPGGGNHLVGVEAVAPKPRHAAGRLRACDAIRVRCAQVSVRVTFRLGTGAT